MDCERRSEGKGSVERTIEGGAEQLWLSAAAD